MRELQEWRDARVREELGIPRTVAAKLAGVSKNTLILFEAAPNAVSEPKRVSCAQLYALLRTVLAKAPGRKGG